MSFVKDFPLIGINDSVSCKKHTLKCLNPSAGDSFDSKTADS